MNRSHLLRLELEVGEMLPTSYLSCLAMLLEFVWVEHCLPHFLMYLPHLVLDLSCLLALFLLL